MINRILIRIKVVQMVYSFMVSQSGTKLSDVKKDLVQSLRKAYELYYYLLLLPVELTRLQAIRLDNAKNKYLPTKEDMFPNTKFIDNLFVKKLESCEAFNNFIEENLISWESSSIFLRLTLDKILHSEIYEEYMAKDGNSLAEDADFWRNIFKKIIFQDDSVTEELESKSIYWNDDLETIGTFVLKTMKRFEQDDYNELLPQFKDDEDRKYADLLLTEAISNKEEYMKLIDMFVSKESWDTDRLAQMDIVILLVAIAELENVPSVPVVVTINEFVEIAKSYSTAKSGQFINGILNSIINYLKSNGKLYKNEIK